jgi:hypothetical protein
MATLTSPTLDRLILETRIMLNQQDATSSFWSDAELTMYLTDAVNQYFLEIEERCEGQFDVSVPLGVVSGTETVALPSDCFKVKALYANSGSGSYTMLNYVNNLTQSFDSSPSGGGSTYAPSYYFRGNSLVLRPIPGFTQTDALLLEYTQFPERMIWGGDSLTNKISPVFKELLVMYAVEKAKIKEDLTLGGNTSDKASMHLAKIEKKFLDTLGPRSNFPQFVKPFNP